MLTTDQVVVCVYDSLLFCCCVAVPQQTLLMVSPALCGWALTHQVFSTTMCWVMNSALMAAIEWSAVLQFVNGVITRRRDSPPPGSRQRQCEPIAASPVIKALVSLFERPAVV